MENVVIKINIKTFLNYEKLTGKSFQEIDYTSADDIGTLLYSCFIANNNNYKLTQDNFNLFVNNNKKFAHKITKAFQEEIEFTKQFQSKDADDTNDASDKVLYLKDVVPILAINCHLDINYILYELELTEIQSYLETYNNQVQQNMEMERLWCYYSILPHVDGKKLKSPKDLIQFPWEVEQQEDVLAGWDANKLEEMLNTKIKE